MGTETVNLNVSRELSVEMGQHDEQEIHRTWKKPKLHCHSVYKLVFPSGLQINIGAN